MRGTSRFNAPSYHQEVEAFATLAGIRDTWQKNDPRWQQACEQAEALQFWPAEELLGLPPEKWPSKIQLGPVLFQRKLRSAQKAIDGGWRFTSSNGTRVIVFEGTRQTSDAAEILGSEVDLVVGFNYRMDKEHGQLLSVIYSTRSHTGFDCSAYAKSHSGGGGHKAAAGFTLPLQIFYEYNPYKLLWDDLHTYEGRTPEHEWNIKLNRYQRDNLVWLLAACGYGDEGSIEPFTLANTGDWLGEIALKLNCEDGVGNPNMSLDDLRKALKGT